MQVGKLVRKIGSTRVFSIFEMTGAVVKLCEMNKEKHNEWLDPKQDLVIIPVSLLLSDYEELV
jgi:hypothetical protein